MILGARGAGGDEDALVGVDAADTDLFYVPEAQPVDKLLSSRTSKSAFHNQRVRFSEFGRLRCPIGHAHLLAASLCLCVPALNAVLKYATARSSASRTGIGS